MGRIHRSGKESPGVDDAPQRSQAEPSTNLCVSGRSKRATRESFAKFARVVKDPTLEGAAAGMDGKVSTKRPLFPMIDDNVCQSVIVSGRVHRSGKEFHPKVTSQGDDDVVEANKSDVHVKAVPLHLYELVQKALAMRENPVWKEEVPDIYNELKSIEARIQLFAERCIPEMLPHGWKYDPITAKNLVPMKTSNRNMTFGTQGRPRKKKTCDRCCHKFPRFDKNGNEQKFYQTSITEKMKPSWDEFKKFDCDIPMLDYFDQNDEEQKTHIPCELPFVKDISNFALDSFNKAIDTRVKYKPGKLSDLEVMESYYLKLEPDYWFCMMIKANEDGKRGVYDVQVDIGFEDGLATLSKFDFLQFDDEKSMEIDESEDGDVEYDSDDYVYSGLVKRRVTKGYNYRYQHGYHRIWRT